MNCPQPFVSQVRLEWNVKGMGIWSMFMMWSGSIQFTLHLMNSMNSRDVASVLVCFFVQREWHTYG